MGDQPHTAVFGDDDIALVGVQLSGKELEEGRFPCAVSAQEADALSGFDLEGNSIQDVVSYFKRFL